MGHSSSTLSWLLNFHHPGTYGHHWRHKHEQAKAMFLTVYAHDLRYVQVQIGTTGELDHGFAPPCDPAYLHDKYVRYSASEFLWAKRCTRWIVLLANRCTARVRLISRSYTRQGAPRPCRFTEWVLELLGEHYELRRRFPIQVNRMHIVIGF